MFQPEKVDVRELHSTRCEREGPNGVSEIRTFSLSTNGIVVEVCSLGASITKFLVPSYQNSCNGQVDDVVLGYSSPLAMLECRNPPYFGVVVGRVANRIANGTFVLPKMGASDTLETFNLEKNNGPNHLHGGRRGFGHCVWDGEIIDVSPDTGSDNDASSEAIKFSLLSRSGDQGYPGKIHVTATYSLIPKKNGSGAALRLVMKARFGEGEHRATPINLAQHSYFNLASHNDAEGVIGHHLTMPCQAYTPIDATSIPTRTVQSVETDPMMDWRSGKTIRDALTEYGIKKARLSPEEATNNMSLSRRAPHIATAGTESLTPGQPYGFDHNYVIEQKHKMNVAGILQHEQTKRRLTVLTDAPGVQVYTANYLDGVSLNRKICKSNACYGQWQGLCLETQHYPDSIHVDSSAHPEFAKGACPVLSPGSPDYSHTVEYHIEPVDS